MRITKKYAGKSCIGKQIYQPCEGFQDSPEIILEAEKELEALEKAFLRKIQAKSSNNSPNISSAEYQRKRNSTHRVSQLRTLATTNPNSNPNGHFSDYDEEEATNLSSDLAEHYTPVKKEEPEKLSPSFQRFSSLSRNPFENSRRPTLRRNLSAPVLLSFHQEPWSPRHGHHDEYISSHRHHFDDFYVLTERIPLGGGGKSEKTIPSSQNSSGKQSNSSFTAKKRSHSVMALLDFEKLVTDEQAAGKDRQRLGNSVLILLILPFFVGRLF
jgi:hypothetical protein